MSYRFYPGVARNCMHSGWPSDSEYAGPKDRISQVSIQLKSTDSLAQGVTAKSPH